MTATSTAEEDTDSWRTESWTKGSYPAVAPQFAPMGAHLVDHTAVGPDDEVLDVGCGTGTVAIAAARAGATATGLDITPALLERARENAATAGVAVEWDEGDAADLPYAADSFDATLSSLGHIYATPPDRAGSELARVTRPGGRVGYTCWTPGSLYPQLAAVVLGTVPASARPTVEDSPVRWGDPATARDRLESHLTDLTVATDSITVPALSPAHFWERTAATSGMFVSVLEGLDEGHRAAVREQAIQTIEPLFDTSRSAVELEYRLVTGQVPR